MCAQHCVVGFDNSCRYLWCWKHHWIRSRDEVMNTAKTHLEQGAFSEEQMKFFFQFKIDYPDKYLLLKKKRKQIIGIEYTSTYVWHIKSSSCVARKMKWYNFASELLHHIDAILLCCLFETKCCYYNPCTSCSFQSIVFEELNDL